MATTLESITAEFYNITGTPADDGTGKNTIYNLSFAENLANVVQREICRSWKWPFLRTKSLFDVGVNTNLAAAVDTADLTITVGSTTGFPSSGAVWIEHDIVNYTGKTSTQLTGCTNIGIDHAIATRVEPIYAVPSNFGQRPTLWTGKSNSGLRSSLFKYQYLEEDVFDYSERIAAWTITTDADGVQYIRIRNYNVSTAEIAVLKYYKIPATMNTTTPTNATIPDEFALEVIPRIMAGVASILRGDNIENIGTTVMAVAKENIKDMKKYFGMQWYGEKPQIKVGYASANPRFSKNMFGDPQRWNQ